MTTPLTSVDIQGMIEIQPAFQNAVDEVNTTYTNMSEQINTLAANWTGDTANAFIAAAEQWLTDLEVVDQNLQLILEGLAHHTHIYANIHGQSQQVAQAFANGLTSFPINLGI